MVAQVVGPVPVGLADRAGPAVVAGLVDLTSVAALREHAGRRARMTTTRGTTFTTTHRVRDRVLSGTTHLGTASLVARTPRLTQRDVHVIGVADRADRGPAHLVDAAHLARRHHDDRITRFARHQTAHRTGATRDLTALAREEFDVVHIESDRDVAETHRVTGLRLGLGAVLDDRSNLEALGREDVTLQSVRVADQRDVRTAVGVVLDRLDRSRDPLFVPLEVDQAVVATSASTTTPGGHAAVAVTSARPVLRLEQRLLGGGAGDLERKSSTEPWRRPGDGGVKRRIAIGSYLR